MMSLQPSQNPVVQQLQLLLTGYGYNFYYSANQARADDMLVRERASYHLAQVVNILATLRSAYQQRFIPPLTRANPDPPQAVLAQAREMEAIQQDISNAESYIRGMSVPTQDRIWWRFRQEEALLMQLLNLDLALVSSSERMYQYASQLVPEVWDSQGAAPLRTQLQRISQFARDRERLLLLPL